MKQKKCLNCGYVNDFADIICTRCGRDITNPSDYEEISDENDNGSGSNSNSKSTGNTDGTGGSGNSGSSENTGKSEKKQKSGKKGGSGDGTIYRLWSVGMSKFLTTILTLISLGITLVVLYNYNEEKVNAFMNKYVNFGTFGDNVAPASTEVEDENEEIEGDAAEDTEIDEIETNESETGDEKKQKKKKKKNNNDKGDYILPDSNKKYISVKTLRKLSKKNLAIARNEIYARRGYIFEGEEWQEYFGKKSWYNPQYSADDFNSHSNEIFNKYEKKNIKRIVKVEKEKG